MSLSGKTKRWLTTSIKIVISVVLLCVIYSKIEVEETMTVLKTANLLYIFIALVIFIIINGFLLVRWGIFIKALGLKASWVNIARHLGIGLFGNLFMPSAIGGDVIKTVGLCSASSQKPKVVASVLLDRLSGFGGMVLVAFVSFVCGYKYINDMSLFLMIVAMASVSFAIVFVLFNETLYSFCCKIFTPFPKLKQGLMNMHYDIVLLKGNTGAIYRGVGLAALGQICFAYTFFLIAMALHQDVSYFYFLIFVPLLCVAACFPSIGGLGVREVGAVYLFGKIGIEAGIAVSMSLMSFLFMVVIGLMGWVFYMGTETAVKKKE